MAQHYTAVGLDEISQGSIQSAQIIIPLLMSVFRPTSVLDVGCGLGYWLKTWQQSGVEDFLGVDGGEIISSKLLIPADKFRHIDLRSPFDLGRRFSLVQSLEVAEHLPESCAVNFVRSLTRHGDLVLFSAAIPGQIGYRHLNEQWPSYWIRIFGDFHFLPSDLIRPAVWINPDVRVWYKQNTLMFIHESRASEFESYLPSISATAQSFDLVHPDLFATKIEHPENWATASQFPIRKLVLALCKAVLRKAKYIMGLRTQPVPGISTPRNPSAER